jgi:hypothetical protein
MSSKKSEVARALDRSEVFHGKPPRRIRRVRIKYPKAVVLLGACAQLDYVSDKWDGKLRRYFHEFKLSDPKRPCLVFASATPQPDGSNLLIIKGHFRIDKDGIIG